MKPKCGFDFERLPLREGFKKCKIYDVCQLALSGYFEAAPTAKWQQKSLKNASHEQETIQTKIKTCLRSPGMILNC